MIPTEQGSADTSRGGLDVLFVAYRLPYPPDKGERIRAYHQILYLSRHARVHLVCPRSPEDAPSALAAMRTSCASVHAVDDTRGARVLREVRALAAGRPRMAAAFVSRGLRQAVRRVLATSPIDAILVSTLHAAGAVRDATDVPRALDLMDAYGELWDAVSRRRRGPVAWASREEARRLRAYEARLLAAFDRTIVVSQAEADALGGPGTPAVDVIGNGVDLDGYRPVDGPAPAPPTFVFVGSMDYVPNDDAVRHFHARIWPRIRAAVADARFVVVGRRPGRRVRALADGEGVVVTGEVPDVRPYLAAATAAVVPLRIARGVQNKVLEAMASGIPVVATSSALAGLGPAAACAVERADGADAFADAAIALAHDEVRRAELARRGRAYVEAHHRWEDQGARLLALLHGMTAGDRQR